VFRFFYFRFLRVS